MKLLTTADFNFYFTDSTAAYINTIDTIIGNRLGQLQRRLNYHTSRPIDVFIESGQVDLQHYYEEREKRISNGEIILARERVVLNVNQSAQAISESFSLIAADILVDEMMYGGTLQDKVKSTNLINLPTWVLPGLRLYLTYGWSPELDNQLRTVHDEYGLQDFNAIPQRYDDIKGAAFWKFMEHNYGESAIPTVLYMARLTRKFNASVYYSFQTSVHDIYMDWKDYYSRAYSSDQKKPNPIDGIPLDSDLLLDFLVISENEYYTLEKSFTGFSLFKNIINPSSRRKILNLKKNEVPLPKFAGAISNAGKKVSLVCTSSDGVVVYNLDRSKKSVPISGVTYVRTVGKDQYFAQSSLLSSNIWKYTSGKMELLASTKGYINSFDVSGNSIVWAESKGPKTLIKKASFGTADYSLVLESSHNIRQVIFANDSTLIYNSSENGIWNGKLFNIATSEEFDVTNYRSNILSHQYSDKVFVEFLDRGEFSAIYITEHIKAKDFYTYENLEPTYFNMASVEEQSIEVEEKNNNIDSLESYVFQSPVHPTTDFTVSNYDSLQELNKNSISNRIEGEAPEYFSASSVLAELTNVPHQSEVTTFDGAYRTLLPNYLNIRVGGAFQNQYQNRSLGLTYTGVLQPLARDISAFYSFKRQGFNKINILHRKRIMFDEESRDKYRATILSYSHVKRVSPFLSVEHLVQGRNESLIPQLTGPEVESKEIQNNWLLDYSSGVFLDRRFRKNHLSANAKIAPMLDIASFNWNVSASIDLLYKSNLNKYFDISQHFMGATSQGSAPVFYIIGGQSNDLLSSRFNREFSTFKPNAAYSNMFGVRGFTSNYRNGNTYAINSTQLSFKAIDFLFKRPIASEFFSNMKFNAFLDMGTAFYGAGVYDEANTLSKRTVVSPAGGVVIEVNEVKNPLIMSFGPGISTRIYGYNVSLDYAIGYEDQKLKSPQIHLGLGRTL